MLLLLLFTVRLASAQSPGSLKISQVWKADNGDGTYKNPVLHADYSDPDAIRVGEDYYMTASSFNCIPGLPILHSKDLVNWKLINHALKKQRPAEVYNMPMHGKGVWAPTIRFHKGEFLIYYPDPDYGIYLVKTKNIYEDWSEPEMVLPGKGIIDPAPFWDADGKAYLVSERKPLIFPKKSQFSNFPFFCQCSLTCFLGEQFLIFHFS